MARGNRGGTFAATAAAPVVSTVFNVETIDTTSNLEARTGDAEGFIAYNKTSGQFYVAYGSNLWNKHNAD